MDRQPLSAATVQVSRPIRDREGSAPRRIQAWREVKELPDREQMRDGRWLV